MPCPERAQVKETQVPVTRRGVGYGDIMDVVREPFPFSQDIFLPSINVRAHLKAELAQLQ